MLYFSFQKLSDILQVIMVKIMFAFVQTKLLGYVDISMFDYVNLYAPDTPTPYPHSCVPIQCSKKVDVNMTLFPDHSYLLPTNGI